MSMRFGSNSTVLYSSWYASSDLEIEIAGSRFGSQRGENVAQTPDHNPAEHDLSHHRVSLYARWSSSHLRSHRICTLVE